MAGKERERATTLPEWKDITQEHIEQWAQSIGEHFGLPDEVIKRGKDTQLAIVNDNVFEDLAQQHRSEVVAYAQCVKNNLEDLLKENHGIDLYANPQTQELKEAAAIFIFSKDARTILVKKSCLDSMDPDEFLTHELLHSMGSENWKHRGFLSLAKNGYIFMRLEEAAAEFLTVLWQYRAHSITELPRGAFVRTSYSKETTILGGALLTCYPEKERKSAVDDLVQHYFGLNGPGEDGKPIEYIKHLMDKTPEKSDGVFTVLMSLSGIEIFDL